jgi:hypothetical protein
MERGNKQKLILFTLVSWLMVVSCKVNVKNPISGLGKAIGDVFRSIADSFGF